jgi:hypothetical protein
MDKTHFSQSQMHHSLTLTCIITTRLTKASANLFRTTTQAKPTWALRLALTRSHLLPNLFQCRNKLRWANHQVCQEEAPLAHQLLSQKESYKPRRTQTSWKKWLMNSLIYRNWCATSSHPKIHQPVEPPKACTTVMTSPARYSKNMMINLLLSPRSSKVTKTTQS